MPLRSKLVSAGCSSPCEGWNLRRLLFVLLVGCRLPHFLYMSKSSTFLLDGEQWLISGCLYILRTVLGLNDAPAARKLVRLLLADPLNPREDWEDILDSYDADTSRGLLIRY